MNTQDSVIPFRPKAEEAISCPSCDSLGCKLDHREHKFEYGSKSNQVVLSATIPVWTCRECNFTFTGSDAEEIIHDTICRHLNLLTPKEILGIRSKLHLTQKEFADLIKVGEASVKRWESGALIQNASTNMLLNLCNYPHVRALMETINTAPGQVSEPKFKTPISDDQKRKAKIFQLRVG